MVRLKVRHAITLSLGPPTFFDRNGWFLLPQTKKDEEKDQWDEDLKGQHPLRTRRDQTAVCHSLFESHQDETH